MAHHFDHIRYYYLHLAILGDDQAFKRYWGYMLRC